MSTNEPPDSRLTFAAVQAGSMAGIMASRARWPLTQYLPKPSFDDPITANQLF
jgi:hypothetical protein